MAVSSTVQANKERARQLFEALEANDAERLSALIDPDGEWWTLSRRSKCPNRQQLRRFHEVYAMTREGISFKVGHMIGEDDHVAVAVESRAEFADGKVYNNMYYWILRFSGEQIAAVWEYFDTAHAAEIFANP